MSKTAYVVNGEVVSTLKEVADVVGVKRVTVADIKAGKYPNVDVVDTEAEEAKAFVDEHIEVIHVGDTPTDPVATDDAPTNTEDVPGEEQLEYPEVGDFADVKAMKKYIKKLSDEQLAEWCELEGAKWNPSDHEAINRMRMAMAIKAIHFPETAPKAGKSKKKSKYAQYSTEELVQMALDNDVEVKDDKGDPRILRMYTIMALREAGIIS